MVIVLCNCPVAAGPAIARALVDEGLAACVNVIGPVTSVYRWQGAVHEDAELTLMIKTASERVATLCDRVRALHPHQTPELLVLPVDLDASDPAYIAWVRASTLLG